MLCLISNIQEAEKCINCHDNFRTIAVKCCIVSSAVWNLSKYKKLWIPHIWSWGNISMLLCWYVLWWKVSRLLCLQYVFFSFWKNVNYEWWSILLISKLGNIFTNVSVAPESRLTLSEFCLIKQKHKIKIFKFSVEDKVE